MSDSNLVSILLTLTSGGLLFLIPLIDKPQLTSTAFGEGKTIPTIYANTGIPGAKNISPPLKWVNAPAEAKSFALACIDQHPIAAHWVHWLVVDIPRSANNISEGASRSDKMPAGSIELQNSFGAIGWGGPQPPQGTGVHKYEFLLYCLNVEKLNLSPHVDLAGFNKAIQGKVITTLRLEGTYAR